MIKSMDFYERFSGNTMYELQSSLLSLPSNESKNDIINILNKMFPEYTCAGVKYTRNTGEPFGIMIGFNPTYTEEPYSRLDGIGKYYTIEFDSKLLDCVNKDVLNNLDIILLHDLSNILIFKDYIDDLNGAYAIYETTKNNRQARSSTDGAYTYEGKETLVKFAECDFIRKSTSIFERPNTNTVANELINELGRSSDLNLAFEGIHNSNLLMNLTKDGANKMIVLSWALHILEDPKNNRLEALRVLRDCKEFASSEILATTLNNLEYVMTYDWVHHDYNSLNESSLRDKYIEKKNNAISYNIKGFENDLYEFQLKARHTADIDEAMLMLRDINKRISILDDYALMCNGSNESAKAEELVEKYNLLRQEISEKGKFRYDYSGSVITVSYPKIVENRTD